MSTDLNASRTAAARALADLLAAEGVAICTMPRMFGILMRRACPEDDANVAALELALSSGIVAAMREKAGSERVPELAEQLVTSLVLSEEHARWTVETWWRALQTLEGAGGTETPRAWTDWNRLDVTHTLPGVRGTYQRSILHLAIMGAAGACGGATWGIAVLLRGERALPSSAANALEELDGWLRLFALFALGGLGGFAGGLFGWIGGGAWNWTCDAHGATTLGRLGQAALGAFLGALLGGLAGLASVGLIGMMIGALAGAAVAAFVGLLFAEQLSHWWR